MRLAFPQRQAWFAFDKTVFQVTREWDWPFHHWTGTRPGIGNTPMRIKSIIVQSIGRQKRDPGINGRKGIDYDAGSLQEHERALRNLLQPLRTGIRALLGTAIKDGARASAARNRKGAAQPSPQACRAGSSPHSRIPCSRMDRTGRLLGRGRSGQCTQLGALKHLTM